MNLKNCVLLLLGVLIFSFAGANTIDAFTSSTGITWSSGLSSWGGTPLGGSGGGGGFTKADAIAALQAIINQKFQDPAFQEALLLYMAQNVWNAGNSSSNPQTVSITDLIAFINQQQSTAINSLSPLEQQSLREVESNNPVKVTVTTVEDAQGNPYMNYLVTGSDTTPEKAAAMVAAAALKIGAPIPANSQSIQNALNNSAKAAVIQQNEAQRIAAINNAVAKFDANRTAQGLNQFIKDCVAAGDTYKPDETGMTAGMLYKPDGTVDTTAYNELTTNYDPCLDGFADAGGGGGGGGNTGGSTTPTVSACSSYTYNAWGACYSGTQTRTIASQSPSGCTDTSSADLSQDCTVAKPVVTNTTNAAQTSASPTLSVSTDRAASCQYSESSGFAYGSGTTFDTTANFNHNTALRNLKSGSHTYYVACKDSASGGVSDALKLDFKVDLSQDPNNAPLVSNNTPAAQTTVSSTLAVTTDRKAACQYKEGSTFTYGSATAMTTSDNYSHSVSITSLIDGSHTFYVICKDDNTGAVSAAKQVTTVLDRSAATGGPTVTITTATYQTTSGPTLSVTTDKTAVCQYNTGSFAYGAGAQFGAAATVHSAQLQNISDGQHTYYVVCKDNASGITSAAAQIIFTINTSGGAYTCADLTSNDRSNDSNRSYSGTASANSYYPWQAVETGTREKFAKVDWYAGYQFTPGKDGRITQLCGYFDSGVTNRVFVSDGSYNVLVDARIAGSGSWKCVDISPLPVVTDKRYYVIAQVVNNPLYFEYKPNLFPKSSGNVTIEAGVRQANVNGVPGNVTKYDYMLFGLVDFRISFAPASSTGPEITSVGPAGAVNATSAQLLAQTGQNATCRFGREDVDFAQMSYALPKTSANNYSQKVCGLQNGTYTFYARCQNSDGVANNASKQIQFNVSQ